MIFFAYLFLVLSLLCFLWQLYCLWALLKHGAYLSKGYVFWAPAPVILFTEIAQRLLQ